MRYQTFDLTISAAGAPQEYWLTAQTSHHGETTAPIKTQMDTSVAPLADWLAQLAKNTISSPDLQQLGKKLYETLFAGEINLLLNRALGETIGRDDLGLRLRLRINPPELAALPWEYLYSPERRLFLSASVETPLSRYINLNKPLRRLAPPERVRMLVVIPQNTDLDTAAEYEMLQKIAGKLHDRLVVDFLPGLATTAAIRAALREKAYHIFHYAGHGAFKNDAAFLYLDHETKFTEAISAERFAHFFAEHASTRLAVLNACQGAARSAQQALAGLAPQLVFHDVPAVIAMQARIANDEAILFATEFYEELCYDGQIEAAISRARKALWQERPASTAFGNPVLYLRAEDGRLWEAEKTELPKSSNEEKKNLLERWQTWVGLIGGILAILAALTELPEKVVKMTGVFGSKSKGSSVAQAEATGYLRVFVIDSTTRAPLAEVTIRVEEIAGDTTVRRAKTTSDGGVHFANLPAPLGARARVSAERAGYRSKNEYTFLPGPLRLELEKIE